MTATRRQACGVFTASISIDRVQQSEIIVKCSARAEQKGLGPGRVRA
jgi:hypothetical protein